MIDGQLSRVLRHQALGQLRIADAGGNGWGFRIQPREEVCHEGINSVRTYLYRLCSRIGERRVSCQ